MADAPSMYSSLGQVYHHLRTTGPESGRTPEDRELLCQKILADPEGAAARLGIPLLYEPKIDPSAKYLKVDLTTLPKRGETRATCPMRPNLELLPLNRYDKILVGFSGGKDSVACALTMYERLVAAGLAPEEHMELWHHGIDGSEDDPSVWDWPCTPDFCNAFAEYLGVPILHQYRKGGIHAEMWKGGGLREDFRRSPELVTDPASKLHGTPVPECKMPTCFQTWNEQGDLVWVDLGEGRKRCTKGVRHLYPQVASDLNVRWCTAVAKIDVADETLRNDPRFNPRSTYMMVTGERRGESNNRARYSGLEAHRSNSAIRPVWGGFYEVVRTDGRADPPADVVKLSHFLRGMLGDGEETNSWLVSGRNQAMALARQLKDDDSGSVIRPVWFLVDSWRLEQIKRGRDPDDVRAGAKRSFRYGDHLRPVVNWDEEHVWEIARRWGVVPHPCYWLGYSRASCLSCVFLLEDDVSTFRDAAPQRFQMHCDMERCTGQTLHPTLSWEQRAEAGVSFQPVERDPNRSLWDYWHAIAMDKTYRGPSYVDPAKWRHPMGAFRSSGGPD